jgi:TonB family protein
MLIALVLLQAASSPAPAPIDPGSWITSNDYPFEAQKNGDQGSVQYEVTVDQLGRARDCRIIVSSGHSSLDVATCNIVTSKGRFRPALGADGRPIASTYKGTMTWRTGYTTPTTWRATILDFGDDPHHPKCTEQNEGSAAPISQQSCSSVLQQKEFVDQVGRKFTRVVSLFASSDGGHEPYRGDPSWGERLSLLASEQYYLGGSYPVACKTVAAEGNFAGRDACAGMPTNRNLSADELKRATKTRVEISTFGVLRESKR